MIGGLLREGERDPVRIFGFIAAKRAEHSIKLMCRVLEVSRSGYHAWARRRIRPSEVITTSVQRVPLWNRKGYAPDGSTRQPAS